MVASSGYTGSTLSIFAPFGGEVSSENKTVSLSGNLGGKEVEFSGVLIDAAVASLAGDGMLGPHHSSMSSYLDFHSLPCLMLSQ